MNNSFYFFFFFAISIVSAVFVFCHIGRFGSLFRCILFPQRSQNVSVALGQEVTTLLAISMYNCFLLFTPLMKYVFFFNLGTMSSDFDTQEVS